MKSAKQSTELIDCMGSDLSVVNAARVSFDKESEWFYHDVHPQDNYSGKIIKVLSEKDTKLLSYLAKHNHWSPFSHATASFRVKAPIFVARQLAKHQVGFSWNEVSRRYVDSEPEFYFPEVWRHRAENVKQGSSEEVVSLAGYFPEDSARLALRTYQSMLIDGVCPEQARMVLPQNTMTEWVWTGSLYGWARMCKLRLDSHTQKETQEIAEKVSEALKAVFPVSWSVLLEN